jgi:Holliday junction resolvasome RuvABC endonuclease subunit
MRNISILAFDLGNKLGWSKCNCVLQPQVKLSVVEHNTVYLDELTDAMLKKDYNSIYSRRRVKINLLEDLFSKIIEDAGNPDAIVVEDIFCMPNRVSAFVMLTLYLETLERVVNCKYKKKLICIPTKICKQVMANSGSADKDAVKEAILANPSITVRKPEKLSEHSCDSIAVAYAFAKNYLAF